MDQGPLVMEQMDVGAKLVSEFNGSYKPLQSAFWLKESDDGEWYLYLVSDQINDSTSRLDYTEVIRLVRQEPDGWLDPIHVKVRGIHDSVAKDVLALQQRYPGKLPIRLRNLRLGGRSIEEVYIYSFPIAATN